jgi:hypothetical protein
MKTSWIHQSNFAMFRAYLLSQSVELGCVPWQYSFAIRTFSIRFTDIII